MAIKEFEFQQNCIQDIINKFEEQPIVYLNGDSGTGKTTISQQVELPNYEKLYLVGDPTIFLTDLGVFKRSSLFNFQEGIKKALDVTEVLASLFPPAQVGISKVNETLNIDSEFILKELHGNRNILLIIDNYLQIDILSQSLISQVVEEIRCFPRIKILFVGNNEKRNTILIPPLSINDLEKLGFDKNSTINKVPLNILLYLSKNHNVSNVASYPQIIDYLNADFLKKIRKFEENSLEKFILEVVYLYSGSGSNEWVDIATIVTYLIQKKITRIDALIDSLISLFLLEIDSSDKFIRFNTLYNSIRIGNFLSSNLEEELNGYIDYIEQFAPFSYFDKFQAYSLIGNYDLTEKNALQCYLQFSLEQGKEFIPTKVKEYLKKLNTPIVSVVVESLELYTNNIYDKSFHLTDSFIENLQGSYFPYPIEIIGNLFYLRALSLARAITQEPGTLYISNEHIKSIQMISKRVKNINSELYLRLKKAELILKIDSKSLFDKKGFKKDFDVIVGEYDFKITSSLARYKKYWQKELSILFSLVGMIDLDVDKEEYILRRSFHILNSQKEFLPKSYIRAASNYAATNFKKGDYQNAINISERVLEFIDYKGEVLNWGVVPQLHMIYMAFNGQDIKQQFGKFNDLIWNIPEALGKLHEKYICISNHSLLLCAINDSAKQSIELMELTLEKAPRDNYDRYLFYTNLGALYYLDGNSKKASSYEQKALEVIEEGIDCLIEKDLIKRNEILQQIYSGNISSNSKEILTTIFDSTETKNKFYFKLGFFSDIAYWSN
ncbi:MAG: tetratricopeptide repeat protein [Streptococcaceae bacterium]|jgi:hypothetical protein|nr:tetratricopeptide repeat protein [Streptococcaceae bacterium]